jgi:phosphoribosylglycinamide formyltransferase 1
MAASIIIFASGGGSNAIAIQEYAVASKKYKIACMVSNNPKAAVLQYAAKQGIPSILVNKEMFQSETFIETLQAFQANLIVLAGFLWLIPKPFINAFANKIVNIHPSLLPKFGGAGMYGHYVHEAVVAAKEKESGITIHMVNEEYDKGKIIMQKSVAILPNDTAEDVAKKVLALEHLWYKKAIEQLLSN